MYLIGPQQTAGVMQQPQVGMMKPPLMSGSAAVPFRPATAFNPSSNYENAYNQRRQQDIMNYYRRVGAVEASSTPITVTWNVNAYVKANKENIFKRCCNKIRRRDKMSDAEAVAVNPYQNPYSPPATSNGVKHILKNVTGIVKPGQLCAIMGASGAGKTTLLNIINFRNKTKNLHIEGDIRINGKQTSWKEITAMSGYVQQEDVFIGTLKVREHLTFLAQMKMGRHHTNKEKAERVEQIMTEMNLLHIKETYIGQGDRLKGISGGEKRRLAFASEVLTNPQLLFCDEPTSGLDSFMAQSIVDSMVLLARQGKTVICTIHQPSSQMFEKFDTLCLLGEGRTAYMGPTNEAPQFFQSVGHPVPHLYNPADHYIQVLAIMPNSRDECLRKVNQICDTFVRSKYQQEVNRSIAQAHAPNSLNQLEGKTKRLKYNASYLSQVKWLLWRQHLNSIREPIATRVLVIQTLFVGVLLGLLYLQLDKDQEGVQNRIGLLFILLIQTSFGYIFPVINSFPLELGVFYRETKNRVYSVLPYYLAKQLAELPKFIIFPFTLVTITYWMADILKNGEVYIIIVLLFLVVAQISLSLGMTLSVLAPNSDAAIGLAAPCILPLLIFGGLFLNNESTPDYFVWVKYLSFYYYANEAINVKLWTNVDKIPCTLPDLSPTCKNPRCFDTGRDVLSSFSLKESNYDRDIGLLMLLLFLPRIIGYFILKIKSNRL